MTGIVSVYAVFADEGEADRIARAVVEERLAACANILGACRSIYRWQGKIEEAKEVAAIFKTRADRAEALTARIAALHSYEVPAIAVWPITGAPAAYAAWVTAETGGISALQPSAPERDTSPAPAAPDTGADMHE